MATQTQNVVMQGASGKIGKTLVFRHMADGRTIIAARGRRKAPATPGELAEREKFREAAYIAKARAKDPVLGPQYLARAKPGQGAYHVALAEYLNAHKTEGSKAKPLTKNAYVELARLNMLAAKNLLIEQQIATFVQNALNSAPKAKAKNEPFIATKPQEVCVELAVRPEAALDVSVDLKNIKESEKIPRPGRRRR